MAQDKIEDFSQVFLKELLKMPPESQNEVLKYVFEKVILSRNELIEESEAMTDYLKKTKDELFKTF